VKSKKFVSRTERACENPRPKENRRLRERKKRALGNGKKEENGPMPISPRLSESAEKRDAGEKESFREKSFCL